MLYGYVGACSLYENSQELPRNGQEIISSSKSHESLDILVWLKSKVKGTYKEQHNITSKVFSSRRPMLKVNVLQRKTNKHTKKYYVLWINNCYRSMDIAYLFAVGGILIFNLTFRHFRVNLFLRRSVHFHRHTNK